MIRWLAGDEETRSAVTRGLATPGGAVVLRDNPRRRILRIDGPPTLLVKHFRVSSGRHAGRERLKAAIGRAPASREWRALRRLQAARVPVPAPRALGVLPDGDRILVLEHHAGVPLPEALGSGARARRELLTALGRAVAALHAAGFEHGDLHAGNVHATPRGPLLLDLQRARRTRRHAARLADLGQLDYSLWRSLGAADRVRLAAAALGLRRPFDAAARGLLRDVARAAASRAREHARSRTRRALLPGRRFEPADVLGWRGLRSREADAPLAAVHEHWAALSLGDARVLKRDARSCVTRIAHGDACVVVKEFPPRGIVRALTDCVRGSPARRAWRGGHGLLARGIGAATPLAYLERRVLGVPVASLVVLEDLAPGVDAVAALDLGLGPPERILDALVRLLVALHRRGVQHGDLKGTHVLLRREGEALAVRLLDLEGVRFEHAHSDTERVRALAELNASLPDAYPDALRCRAFTRYARALPFAAGERAALAEVAAASLARAHRWTGRECRAGPTASPR